MLNIKIRKQIIGENLLYLFIWVIVLLTPFMNVGLMAITGFDIGEMLLTWLKILPFFLLFILHNNLLLPFLYYKRRRIIYIIVSLILICGLFSLIEIYERSDMAIALSFGRIGQIASFRHISLVVFPWFGNMIAGVLMFFANLVIKNMYRSMQADEDKERLEREHIQAEMYYLKYQINPHFLMNTLNNIHALIDFDADSAKRGIIELSGMMRYVVYESSADHIPLKQDIKFIENYIELMRIRYAQDIDIQFNYPQGLSSNVTIPPLILVVFVENAFKHGISHNHPSFIHIDIECSEQYMEARFCNSAFEVQGGKHTTGIGLDNVRKRLELIYGNLYELEIDNSKEESYCITLKIPVKRV
ncbi:MAG: histidine kinase [Alistipes sp.]|nr:histidine kinase [Alistipes sp.]MBQ7856653.1 histidine kinase [Alistipes sp.]